MGNDWRSRLRDNHGATTGRGSQDWKVILRQEDERRTDEREHCLRMRRCGATGVRSEVDIIHTDGEGPRRGPCPDYQQIFGWPATGGVWILRGLADELSLPPIPFGAYDFAADDVIQERFWNAYRASGNNVIWKGFAVSLNKPVEEFYPNIEDRFEAVHFRLLA